MAEKPLNTLLPEVDRNFPGLKRIAVGINRLLEANHPNVPALLWAVADMLETEGRRKSVKHIIDGIKEMEETGCNVPFALRYISHSLEQRLKQVENNERDHQR